MDIKRIFGSILTVLGTIGLIFGAVQFLNSTGAAHDINAMIITELLGLLFFITGISIVRTVKEES